MTTPSPGPLHVTKARRTPSPQPAKDRANSKWQRRRKVATVSFGTLLIVGALSIAAGWEIFRQILVIITLD
jgi:hypothetical protein